MTQLRDRLRSTLADRYDVEREVGRGGMATVYLAHDRKHDRQVALKVLHPDLAASLGPDRFLREIQIAARLQHPHILPLYDSGRTGRQAGESSGDFLYYVMPFVEGESLRDRLNHEGQLPVEDAVKIGRDIAAALDYAHRHGIVHRDIKPENVMLHDGEAIVTDFGIAKAVSAASAESLTQTGLAVGTPAYMSPEQAAGEKEPDGRSDVYSLGCVLYEMLTGSAPFTGPTAQALIMKRFTEPVPSVRATRTTVSAELEAVVTKALAKNPDDRFPSASHVIKALGSSTVVTPPDSTPLTSAAKSVAVLPFTDMSPERDQEYFTDGIAEEIINALSKIQALRVASRLASFAFKGKNEDLGEIGKKLKVATVLGGSVRKSGNKLRVSAQLVSVADGYQLWSEKYDRQLEDVFEIQDEIADSIVKALRVMLSDEEKRAIEKVPTENVQAYEYYLRGRQYFHQFRRKGIQFARRMFERAIEVDPGYALAYAGIADCCAFLYMYWDGSKANLESADSASRKALELDPELAEAHASRGFAFSLSRQYDEARREFETAIRLNPKLYEAHYLYARACVQEGRMAEAVQHYEDAARVRPEDYQALMLMQTPLDALGRSADAKVALRRGFHVVEKHLELNPDDTRALTLGAAALATLGQPERAMEWANRALAMDPTDSGVLYNVACTYALGGLKDQALETLERAIENGFGHREWLDHDETLSAVRSDPRFEALRKRI
jgi:serine/threonine protein kinase/Flp pilus assembly protein TadD